MAVKRSVHELVLKQAERAPDTIAVVANGQPLTYGELARRANQLASSLRSSGVGPDVPVALFMQRSAELSVAALGVLIAGGAYVPLDPSYPANRLSMLLEDSVARLVITQSSLADKIPAGSWKKLVLDYGLSDGVAESAASLEPANCDNLAYIIFTSGSTGRPKGVQVTHANLLNLISWHQRQFGVTPADRATLHASPGFDASVWELWPYLTAGASVWVVDETIRTTPEALRDWLIANKITITFLPTALAEAMIDLSWPAEMRLRFLLTGADTLRRRPAEKVPFALINNYGPTECTVVATSGKVRSNCTRQPSLGKPIENAVVHIVNEKLEPVAAGESGELVIGGAGVARGYLNAPDLTAEKFVADPFSKEPDARVYRTGDLARFLPDGTIEFLGRIDEQIKIMGYRVEPREISAVLDQHPAVKESFVTGRADSTGAVRLVAYVVLATSDQLAPSELWNFLSKHLPEFMLPSTFVQLAQIPLSAHGKIDRTALPQPGSTNTLSDKAFEAPQSPVEDHLARFVSSLIGVERVGREDNFFILGGHSLMGAQLIAKIRGTFGVDLPLRTLFDAPTVKGISAEIEKLIYAKVAAMSEGEAQSLLDSSSKIA
jgi:amino acid adenylation domain-containing protein